VSVAVGIWRDGARLDVLSGSSDGTGRAIVTHFDTGKPRIHRRIKQPPPAAPSPKS
jgi:hypothetical protein